MTAAARSKRRAFRYVPGMSHGEMIQRARDRDNMARRAVFDKQPVELKIEQAAPSPEPVVDEFWCDHCAGDEGSGHMAGCVTRTVLAELDRGLQNVRELGARVVEMDESAAAEKVALTLVEPLPAEEVEADVDGAARMKLWLECVAKAKEHVADLHVARDRIVDLALRCCDINWGGGGHWSKFAGMYTARMFARETGVNYKTLMSWLRCRRDIVDHLRPGEWKESDYKYASRTIKKLGADSTTKEKVAAFRKLRDQGSGRGEYRLGTIMQWARSHLNYCRSTRLGKMPRDDLLAYKEILAETIKRVDEALGEPVDSEDNHDGERHGGTGLVEDLFAAAAEG